MNPFSAAIPAGERWPILVDMSSSDSGGLALQRELIKGGLPLGRFFAADGSAVTDPGQWGTDNVNWGVAGGAQRMGGYRDLALTVMVDALAGALTGMMCAMDLGVPEPVVDGIRTPRGQLIIAFDIAHFTPVATFKSKIDRAIDQAKASPLEEGFDEILMPGERGFREEVARRERGVPFEASVWRDMVKWAEQVGVDADAVVARAMR